MRSWQLREGERPTERELEWLVTGMWLGMWFSGNRRGAELMGQRFLDGSFAVKDEAKGK